MTDAPLNVPPRSRKGLYIPVILFMLACLAWTGFWFYARSRAIDVMDGWMAREVRLGRTWTCPERSVAGFPFRFAVECRNPTYTSAEPGRAGTGTLAGLTVTARVVDPRQVIAAFSGPLNWKGAAGDAVTLAFESARGSYRGSAGVLEDFAVELVKPSLSYEAPGLATQTIASAKTEFHLRRAPGTEPATDVALTATGIISDLLNLALKDQAPAALTLKTRLTKLLPSPPRDWRQTAELWRVSEGEAQVAALTFAKGAMQLDMTGQFRLDEMRRPEGTIEGTAQGVETLMQAFGLSLGGNTGAAGGLIGAILSGGKAKPQAKPKAVPFTLRFDQGRMYIGPFPGPRLLPLY